MRSKGFCSFIVITADLNVLEKVEVVYETLPGWESDITGCKKFEELPENCKKYVKFIEDFLGVKIQVSLYTSTAEGFCSCNISSSVDRRRPRS
jgi:adenylosuccinate synthase